MWAHWENGHLLLSIGAPLEGCERYDLASYKENSVCCAYLAFDVTGSTTEYVPSSCIQSTIVISLVAGLQNSTILLLMLPLVLLALLLATCFCNNSTSLDDGFFFKMAVTLLCFFIVITPQGRYLHPKAVGVPGCSAVSQCCVHQEKAAVERNVQ